MSATSFSAPSLLRRVGTRVGRLVRQTIGRQADRLQSTFTPPGSASTAARYCTDSPPTILLRRSEQLTELAKQYLDHRWDLLGSGWQRVGYGARCAGVEGHVYPPGASVAPDSAGAWLEGRMNSANLTRSQQIWRLVDEGYRPIDWQLDFKSAIAGRKRHGRLTSGLDTCQAWT